MQSRTSGLIVPLRDAEEDDIRTDDDGDIIYYWRMPRAFTDKRHTEKIETFQTATQTWRMKERVSFLCLFIDHCDSRGKNQQLTKLSPL
jgi:hypothetical protein